MKEPGQIAYEAWANAVGLKIGWPAEMSPGAWAAVEAAVLEEAAERIRQAWEPGRANRLGDVIRALANPSPASPAIPSEPGQAKAPAAD